MKILNYRYQIPTEFYNDFIWKSLLIDLDIIYNNLKLEGIVINYPIEKIKKIDGEITTCIISQKIIIN